MIRALLLYLSTYGSPRIIRNFTSSEADRRACVKTMKTLKKTLIALFTITLILLVKTQIFIRCLARLLTIIKIPPARIRINQMKEEGLKD